jgi:hypothetical protein
MTLNAFCFMKIVAYLVNKKSDRDEAKLHSAYGEHDFFTKHLIRKKVKPHLVYLKSAKESLLNLGFILKYVSYFISMIHTKKV